jgi:nucleotide-binding universal stress UspA family protein
MFKKIAVGLDGSDGAKRALPFAVRLAEHEGASSATIGVMLGSVAQRLPHVADQPVLVIPERASLPGDASTAATTAAAASK